MVLGDFPGDVHYSRYIKLAREALQDMGVMT